MSENGNFGFGKLVPGFDFLQSLAKGASQTMPQMPNLSNWIAPTLNLEELDKRIGELKAVHFWLDQNGKALGATIQALEVQKMTLATLKGMNFNMGDVANALKLKTGDASAGGTQKAAEAAGFATGAASGATQAAHATASDKAQGNGEAAAGPVDPLQWWGALTQQFQEIASNAMKDVAQNSAGDAARALARRAAKEATKAATDGKSSNVATAAKKPARKAASRKSTTKSKAKSH